MSYPYISTYHAFVPLLTPKQGDVTWNISTGGCEHLWKSGKVLIAIASFLFCWVIMSTFTVPENMVDPAYLYSVNALWELSGRFLPGSLILVLFIGTPDRCIGNGRLYRFCYW